MSSGLIDTGDTTTQQPVGSIFEQILEQPLLTTGSTHRSANAPFEFDDELLPTLVDATLGRAPLMQPCDKPATAHEQREHVAQLWADSIKYLAERYDWWELFFLQVINSGTTYDRNPPKFSRTEEENAVFALTGDILYEELSLPQFADALGTPWLNHARFDQYSSADLYAEAQAAFRNHVERCVGVLLAAIAKGVDNGVFGRITHGDHGARYSYTTHELLDVVESDETDKTHRTKVINRHRTRITHQCDVLHHRCYDFSATLLRPDLLIPLHVRHILDHAPPELRPFLSSLFGKRINQRSKRQEISSKTVTKRYQLKPEPGEVPIDHLAGWADDPCIVFAGVVLFGWNEEQDEQAAMVYAAHAEVLTQQRRFLDQAATEQGAFRTLLSTGFLLLAVVALEAMIAWLCGSFFSAALILAPVLLFAAGALWVSFGEARVEAVRNQQLAEETLQRGTQNLYHQYPGFEPSTPPLVSLNTDKPSSE